jgi:hypothetical protein
VEQPTPEELIQGSVKEDRLGAWHATAICGNDITSSCLHVSAIAIVYAHALAPLALLLAAEGLYLYRKIYIEVVEARPNLFHSRPERGADYLVTAATQRPSGYS